MSQAKEKLEEGCEVIEVKVKKRRMKVKDSAESRVRRNSGKKSGNRASVR